MKILYFTATGNCLHVAKSFGGEIYSIPKLLKDGQFTLEADKIGIVYPIYNGGVPKLVEEFLNKAKLKSKYIFGIGTYGMFAGAANKHLEEVGKRNGIQFSYINDIIMVDNYLPGFEMKKQKEELGKKQVKENLEKIVKDVENGRKYIKKSAILAGALRTVTLKFYDENFEKKFTIDNTCNGCKTCEKVCPVDNIKVDKKPVFKHNCQHCLACIQNCRKKAIHLKNEKSSERFINENISLKEIINANQ